MRGCAPDSRSSTEASDGGRVAPCASRDDEDAAPCPVLPTGRVLEARRRISGASLATASQNTLRIPRLATLLSAAITLGIGPAIAHSQASNETAPVAIAATAAALSKGPCERTQAITPLQRRIVARAAQGPDALRDFIWIMRGVYQLDMESTVAWLGMGASGAT